MQIQGQAPLSDHASVIQLPRQDGTHLSLTLRPLPLGFYRRLRDRGLLPPIPPVRVARDTQGRPLRDAKGQVLTLPDEQDDTYRTAVERYHQRVAILAIAESLTADPDVTLDTEPPAADDASPETWAAYADQLHDELEAFGLTVGDLLTLTHEVCRISGLVEQHTAEAAATFSSGPSVPC